MSALYLLSFLLTGSPEKAEECFAASMSEATKGNPVFREWARSWARRAIIQSAIRLIAPLQHSEIGVQDPAGARCVDELPSALQAEVAAILELAPFERFVFVMSILERYSDYECAILLGCSRRALTKVRSRALQQLGKLMNFHKGEPDAGSEDLAVGESPRPVVELTIAQHFAALAWKTGVLFDVPLRP
jgi:DNA-directed RNA polymerase specialized sigma24 family protein